MPVVGVAEVLIKPVATGAQRDIARQLDGPATAAGKSSGSKMGAALGGALKIGAGTIAGAAVAGLGLALTKGFGRLQAIENARAKLTGLGHDAAAVAQIMKNATSAVKGTAFGLDEAATVAAGAVASGIKPGKDLERTLKLVADSASIANVPMAEMGAIFNKVSSSGKLQGDVLAQLGDKGIPIVSLLGKSMGKTSEEIYDMSKKGQIDFAVFQKAMEQGMGGAALKSGDTLQGSFKNTLASLGRIGANLLSGVYPMFTRFFQGLMKWMAPLEDKAKVVGAAIGVGMERAVQAIGGLYDVLVTGNFTARFREAFHVEEDSPLVDTLFNIRDGLIKTAGVVKGAAAILFTGKFLGSSIMGMEEDSAVVNFLFKLRDGFLSIGAALGDLKFSSWEAFRDSVGTAGGTVGGAFASIGDSMSTLAPAFEEFGRQLPNITGAFMKLGGLSLNILVGGLGFLADHVDTIIAWMPAIVAAFIAWRIATKLLASAQFTLQAAQVAVAPVLLANNIIRYAAIRAETAHSVATGRMTTATNVSLAAKIRDRVATAAGTVVTWASVVAQKAAAVATRLLGAAIKFAMGPVGWIIAGIGLLVAGLVWFFTQTDLGKDIVKNAFAAIRSAIGAVVDWWSKTLVPALKSVGKWFADVWGGAAKAVQVAVGWVQDAIGNVIGWIQKNWGLLLTIILGPLGFIIQWVVKNFSQISDVVRSVFASVAKVFTWVYESVIKPVFDSIFTVVNGFYLFFRGIFQLVVAVFKEIIAPAFMNFWRGVVEPVFEGIKSAVATWWGATKTVFVTVVSFIRNTLSTVFTWFRDSVIMPVFNFVVGYVKWWWGLVSGIFNTVISFIRTVFSAVFTWFRDSVITPVFNFITTVIGTAWRNIKGHFDNIVSFIRTVLSVAFTWLRDKVITPVWNGIRDTIKTVWEKGIKPVFDFLHTAITKTVPSAFQTGVDAIKKIWDTLLDVAKAPVRFVVNTVINDGLIGAFNTVAGILPGIDKLPRVALPKGFHDGGYTGNLPWGAVAGVVHGDEHVIRAESRRGIERKAPGFLDALNRFGDAALERVGFRKGGRVNPTKHMGLTQGFSAFHDGIDIGVPTGTPVFATGNGVVTHADWGASAPGVSGGKEIHIKGDGIERWFAHLSQIGVKLGQQVTAGQQIGLSGNTGISSGPHLHFGAYSGGWPNAMNPLSYLAGASVPKGGDSGGGFFDPLSAIRGLADGVMKQLLGAFPAAGFMVDVAAGIGKKLIGDIAGWAARTLGIGGVTGSPLLYDQGGVLRPGMSQIMNATGRPEAILNPQQWADIHRLAMSGGNGMTYSPTYQWVGDDPHAVMAKDKVRMRDTFAAYGIG